MMASAAAIAGGAGKGAWTDVHVSDLGGRFLVASSQIDVEGPRLKRVAGRRVVAERWRSERRSGRLRGLACLRSRESLPPAGGVG